MNVRKCLCLCDNTSRQDFYKYDLRNSLYWYCNFKMPQSCREILGSAVGWGTMLQARRSQVQFAMKFLNFFLIYIILSAKIWPWRFTQPRTELNNRQCFWGVKRLWHVRLTTSRPLSGVSRILHISQSYRPPQPIMGSIVSIIFSAFKIFLSVVIISFDPQKHFKWGFHCI
jgi:hypothetical protein